MRLRAVIAIAVLLLAIVPAYALPPGCGGSVKLWTDPPGVYVIPPGVSLKVKYKIQTASNTTCVRVKGEVTGALEKVGGGFSCHRSYVVVKAKDVRNQIGKVLITVNFKCKYRKGNETKTESFSRSAGLSFLVDHYVKIISAHTPRVTLIGHAATLWVTLKAMAPAKNVKLWFNWSEPDMLILLANETKNWHSVGKGGYVFVGDMAADEMKTVQISVLAAKKGNVTMNFWPTYEGWWKGTIKGDVETRYMLITDVGMDVPDTELYLTAKNEPYVPIYPNITTFIYLFTSYKAHVKIAVKAKGPEVNWTTQELDMDADSVVKLPLQIKGKKGTIDVIAIFSSLDPFYPFRYKFNDTIKIKRVCAYVLPPIRYNLDNGTIDIDYVTFGTPKSLYIMIRSLSFYYGERYPMPRDMNTSTTLVPVPPCKKGKVCTVHVPLPESPQIDTPEQALYALRSMKGVMASAMWYDSALGFAESVPVPGYMPYLMVGGAAVELDYNTIRLVVFGYSDAVLDSVKVKVYYWYKDSVQEAEFTATPSWNTFLGWHDFQLDANGSYNFVVEVFAKGRRKVTRFITEVPEEEVSWTETLPAGMAGEIPPTEEEPIPRAKEMEIRDIPFYGVAQISYNGAPKAEALPAPKWTHAVLTLALGLAIFMISLAGFLVNLRQAPESITDWATSNLAYVVLVFIGVASASNIFPSIWAFIGEVFGVPDYGEPYNVVLLFVTAASMFLSAIVAGIIESIFTLGFWTGGLLSILGAIAYLFPAVGAVANVAGSFVFEKLSQFVYYFSTSGNSILRFLLSTASTLYTIGLIVSYIMYFIYMFGPLLAVAGLALSALPPFRKGGLTMFLFFTFLYAFLPIFTAPGIAIMRKTVVQDMIPALQSINSNVLSRLGKTIELIGNIFINYFVYIFAGTAPTLGSPMALALGSFGGLMGVSNYITRILYGLAETLLGIVVAFFMAMGFAQALGGAMLTGFNQLAFLGRVLLYKLMKKK